MPALEILRPDAFAALALFAFASSITPGPNNMMLMASGANFGWKRTLPHWLGVVCGFTALLLATGFGLGALFVAFPVLHEILKWAGAAYLLWLAFKIGSSSKLSSGASTGKPMTFLAAVAFQAVNVKAWSMAVGAATAYVPPGNYFGNLVVASVVFAAVNAPCVASWLGFGIAMRRFLDKPKVLRAFNLVMAALLVASLIPVFLQGR
jgi:threonine/homoserine/homoserine lactone efflux protein